jgi:TIGR03009 family protein
MCSPLQYQRLLGHMVNFAICVFSANAQAQQYTLYTMNHYRLRSILPQWLQSFELSSPDQLDFKTLPELTSHEKNRIEQVLSNWEQRNSQISAYECKFNRYVFNAAIDSKNPETISDGVIIYQYPDKWVFKEDTLATLAGTKPDGSPEYKVNPAAPHGDWWVCDGEWVHNLDRREKKAVRTQLPPELRGNNIPLSPLPFLFGVKAAEVKARHFVRGLPPNQDSKNIWIEAWPKRADDAGNYSRIQVSLARSDSHPNAMIIFMPNWGNNSQNREVFNFAQREVNSNNVLDKIKEHAYIEPKVPSDWNIIQEP